MWDNNQDLKKYFHKVRLNKSNKRSFFLQNGSYGIRVLESGFLHANEIKALNVLFKKTFKKFGKIWYNISPNLILTKKPLETRMGKGKGGISEYVAVVQAGHIILEIEGPSELACLNLLNQMAAKLHLSVKIVKFNI